MALVAIVASLALLEYVVILMATGRARGRFGVPAPATTGNPSFERYFRVQQNTIEQLVIFLPSLYLFAAFMNEGVAAGARPGVHRRPRRLLPRLRPGSGEARARLRAHLRRRISCCCSARLLGAMRAQLA